MLRNHAETRSSLVFLVITYNIGKEKVVQAVCEGVGTRAVVSEQKLQQIDLLQLSYGHIFTSEPSGTEQVFIASWGSLGNIRFGKVSNIDSGGRYVGMNLGGQSDCVRTAFVKDQ